MPQTANKPHTTNLAATELAIYADGLVLLTNRRVVFGSRTYWLRSVKKAGVVAVSARRRLLDVVLYIPVILAYLAFLYWQGTTRQPLDWLSAGVFYGGLLLLVAGGAYMLARLLASGTATLYFVTLNRRSVLVTLDESYAWWLAARIKAAGFGISAISAPPFSEASKVRAPGEYLYYSDGFTWLTSHRARFGHLEFPMPTIKGAKVAQLPSSKFQWRLAIAVVLLLDANLLNYFWLNSPVFRSRFYLLYPGDYWILSILLFAGFLVLLVWAVSSLEESTYVLQLRGPSGRVSALASMDSYYCKRLEELIRPLASGKVSRVDIGAEVGPVKS